MGGVKKKIQKIIPKEIKPALPALAAIGLPYLATTGAFGAGSLATKLGAFAQANPGMAAALSNAVTQAATQDKFDVKSAALSGLQAGIGAKLQGADQFKMLKNAPKTAAFLQKTGAVLNPASEAGSFISQTGIPPSSFSLDKALGTASAIGKGALPVATYDAAQDLKELNEKALRDYEAQLREQGIMDSSERRNKIFGYFAGALNTKTGDRLYSDDEINSFLDKYGYATGGVVAARRGLVNRPGGYAGDRKMAAQEYAEELAQDKYGKDFYDLPMTVQMDLYQMALDFVDEGMADGGRVGLKKGGEIGIEVLYRGLTPSARKVVNTIEGAVPNEDDENYEDNDGFKIYPKGTTSIYDLNLDAFNPPKKETGGLGKNEITELAKAIKKDNDEEVDVKDLLSSMQGLEMAFGRPLDMKPAPTRFGLAEGGIPNVMAMRKTIAELIASGVIDEEDVEEAVAQIRNQAMMSMRAPGMAEGGIMNLGGKEMDMRGGGFIPIGSRERADDVPARLSKNEFVMTADAVRAAGGGSINRGAKRMYDLMNRLEAKA